VEHAEALEVDIDLCNPDAGVAPALGHLVEVLWPGKTDPFRARKWIMRPRKNLSVNIAETNSSALEPTNASQFPLRYVLSALLTCSGSDGPGAIPAFPAECAFSWG
jgi:hypothetical protein